MNLHLSKDLSPLTHLSLVVEKRPCIHSWALYPILLRIFCVVLPHFSTHPHSRQSDFLSTGFRTCILSLIVGNTHLPNRMHTVRKAFIFIVHYPCLSRFDSLSAALTFTSIKGNRNCKLFHPHA